MSKRTFLASLFSALLFFSGFQARAHDRGPLEYDQNFTFVPEEGPQSFLLESYGDLAFQLHLTGNVEIRPSFHIVGPLEQDEVHPSSETQIPIASDRNEAGVVQVQPQISLPLPGVYRLTVHASEPQASCLAVYGKKRCARPSISAQELFRRYKRLESLDDLVTRVEAVLRLHAQSPAESTSMELIIAQLQLFVALLDRTASRMEKY